MEAIEKSIKEGGYDSIKSEYYDMVEYNHKTGGTVKYRQRRGGQTEFIIRDGIIGLGLIDKYYPNDQNSDTDSEDESDLIESLYIKGSAKKKSLKPKQVKRDIKMCQEIADLFSITIDKDNELFYILKVMKDLYTKSDRDFVKNHVEKFGLQSIINDALRRLHESIVSKYVHIINIYAKQYPSGVKKNLDPKADYPLNYSDSLVLLKNFLFKENKLNKKIDKIQGFCPYEPIARIQQLLEFPIDDIITKLAQKKIEMPNIPSIAHIYSDLKTKSITIVEPKMDIVKLIRWYAKKIMDRQKTLQKNIIQYEQYYIDISEVLNIFSNYLESSYKE